MARGRVVLFGGPAGAGKTTLAAAWCATRQRAAHLQLDDVRSLIVSGLADPQSGGPLVGQQYDLAVEATCAAARAFALSGYDVAIDDVLEPAPFERIWRPNLQDLDFQVVIVLPQLNEVLRRSAGRSKRVRQDLSSAQHLALQAWPRELRLDTTGLDVAQSLARAQTRGLLP
jgi:chloramphenicol 3-O-phosphotransferase